MPATLPFLHQGNWQSTHQKQLESKATAHSVSQCPDIEEGMRWHTSREKTDWQPSRQWQSSHINFEIFQT